MQSSHSTSSTPVTATLNSWLGKTFLVPSTLTPHPWDQLQSHCHEGFYLGPALHHYCCERVLNRESQAIAITDVILPSPLT
eukprot:CCRYP_000990-RA/>CCRYP_000990-RA protein AED:0.50 eAED:0.50 QI:0/0/0/1/0/0/2/0/80